MRFSRTRLIGAVLPAILLMTGCADTGPTANDPEASSYHETPVSAVSSGPVLVECPTDVTRSVTKTLGALGGQLELDGHSLHLPLGAVRVPTRFTMTVPASRFVEVQVTANDAHSFGFQAAASMTINFERCSRNNIANADLVVYKIDPATKQLIKPMGGSADWNARRVTFSTDSLSGYAIAQ